MDEVRPVLGAGNVRKFECLQCGEVLGSSSRFIQHNLGHYHHHHTNASHQYRRIPQEEEGEEVVYV